MKDCVQVKSMDYFAVNDIQENNNGLRIVVSYRNMHIHWKKCHYSSILT